MGDTRGCHRCDMGKSWIADAQVLEEPFAVAEHYRHEADHHLVDQVGSEVMAGSLRAARE